MFTLSTMVTSVLVLLLVYININLIRKKQKIVIIYFIIEFTVLAGSAGVNNLSIILLCISGYWMGGKSVFTIGTGANSNTHHHFGGHHGNHDVGNDGDSGESGGGDGGFF